jgi:hypothetical protein
MNESYRDYLAAARGHDLGDYIDLIVRKANPKGRECEPNKPLPTNK